MTLPPRPWQVKANGKETEGFSVYDANGHTFMYFPWSKDNEEMMIAIVEFINAQV